MYIRLGVITRVVGLKGEVVCLPDFWETPVLNVPCKCLIGFKAESSKEAEILQYRYSGSKIKLTFSGISSIEAAKELVEQALFIEKKSIEYKNIFANPEFIGYEIFDECANVTVGKLGQIVRSPAHPIWVVENGNKTMMLPAVSQFVVGVQDAQKKIIVKLIEGFEFE